MTGGLLIEGDNDALQPLNDVDHYRGKVKSAYLNPPLGTGQAFQYHDAPDHSSWLGMMQKRLRLVRDLLASDGSVWVHLNDDQLADCRVLIRPVELRGDSRPSEASRARALSLPGR